jgi:hypothetical protein
MKTTQTPDRLWQMQKAKLRLMFAHLDDDDFNYDYGKKEVMMTHLQAKLGKSRDELNLLLGGL